MDDSVCKAASLSYISDTKVDNCRACHCCSSVQLRNEFVQRCAVAMYCVELCCAMLYCCYVQCCVVLCNNMYSPGVGQHSAISGISFTQVERLMSFRKIFGPEVGSRTNIRANLNLLGHGLSGWADWIKGTCPDMNKLSLPTSFQPWLWITFSIPVKT